MKTQLWMNVGVAVAALIAVVSFLWDMGWLK